MRLDRYNNVDDLEDFCMKKGFECNILGVSLNGKYVVACLEDDTIVLKEMYREELGIVTKIYTSITNYSMSPKVFSRHGLSTYRNEVNAILDRVTEDMNIILNASPARQEVIREDSNGNPKILSRLFMICGTSLTYNEYLSLPDGEKEIYKLMEGYDYEDFLYEDDRRILNYFGEGGGTYKDFASVILPNCSFYERIMNLSFDNSDSDVAYDGIIPWTCESCSYHEGNDISVHDCAFRKKMEGNYFSGDLVCDLFSLRKDLEEGISNEAEFFVYKESDDE